MTYSSIITVIPLITKITIIYDRGFCEGILLISPLYFGVITLVRKSNLFPRNYIGLEIRMSGITCKTE